MLKKVSFLIFHIDFVINFRFSIPDIEQELDYSGTRVCATETQVLTELEYSTNGWVLEYVLSTHGNSSTQSALRVLGNSSTHAQVEYSFSEILTHCGGLFSSYPRLWSGLLIYYMVFHSTGTPCYSGTSSTRELEYSGNSSTQEFKYLRTRVLREFKYSGTRVLGNSSTQELEYSFSEVLTHCGGLFSSYPRL